jgi:hypothetical protein
MSTEQENKDYQAPEQEDLQGNPDDNATKGYDVKTTERPIFTFIHQKYGIAKELGDETALMTTAQIHKQVVDHTGDASISVQEVYLWMKVNGYIEHSMGDLEMYWLLKEQE